ncbi:thioredoxin family protein [uncultured Methanolobus sp.]|uniref:thioredoxin family protein n=1 Tax=uncultured Methanolobus sp. TaxID=218300 RepID=UPI0029C84D32|nr:thioredoxin family protein [uncultured Methanolobus sp.]
MNKIILPVVAIIAVLFVVVGLVGDNKAVDDSAIVTTANMQQLNDALSEGPVLVEIGTNSCPACIAQKPIMADIANDYEDKATVMFINTEKTRAMAASFNVYTIPDIFVIAENSDEGYIYMGADGQATTDRNKARYIGITARKTLTDILDAAIEYRQ